MPFMADMVWQGWNQKSSIKGFNYIPQMPPSKFVERSFLVGGFVGSKSQAGSSPSRAYISLNDVIFEQLLNLRLNLCTDIISQANCESASKMISTRVPMQPNFNNWRSSIRCNNWRSNMGFGNKSDHRRSDYYCQTSDRNDSLSVCTKNLTQVPVTKHSQEELVYEDTDEGGNSIYVYQEVQKSTCEVTKTSMFHVRSRTISDCSVESDDSFIIFESNDEDEDNNEVIVADEEEEDEESDVLENFEYDNSSDESNECDEVDYLTPLLECQSARDTPTRLVEANNKWKECYEVVNSQKSPQKVSFANGKQLSCVRTMVAWDFAHRAARKGPWETLALDRCRFKTKIQQLSKIISPILEQRHRKMIFHQRFEPVNPQTSLT